MRRKEVLFSLPILMNLVNPVYSFFPTLRGLI